MTKTRVQTHYEPRIAQARQQVAEGAVIEKLLSEDADTRVLERFLIEYCSLGVQITEPVEGWITRAGEACLTADLPEVGKALREHAKHEAGHHHMFIDDTDKLVASYNRRHGTRLSAQALMTRPPTQAMERYIELHEQTIAGDLPAGQVAIELEIERLSVVLLPDLLSQWERALGKETIASLSFLGSHAQLDVGHTHLNTRLMERLLEARPGAAEALARIGAEALFVYMAFFEECWDAAERACAQERHAQDRAKP